MLIFVLCAAFCGRAQPIAWPDESSFTKPWTRWWWMGSAVDPKNLRMNLDALAAKGFGGVEVTPIYGVRGLEDRYVDYLSDDWMAMLDSTVRYAAARSMGVDMNMGTGWPFGGPQIDQAHAAGRIVVEAYRLGRCAAVNKVLRTAADVAGKDTPWPVAAVAVSAAGERVDLSHSIDTASGRVEGRLPLGDWTLYAAFEGRTLQRVKRAAPGGEGWVMDHFSKDAFQRYAARFDTAFRRADPSVRAFFNDSYEVYGADFTASFFEAFAGKRGYDLKRYLRELMGEGQRDSVARVRADYRKTLGELLLTGFALPWSAWAHTLGKQTKYQAHGSPGNILDLYAAADIPECETFGSTAFAVRGLRRDSSVIRRVRPEPLMLRFASSAGHVSGKKLISAEAFTWLTDHFRTELANCKPEVEQLFLAGVNHVFYHGATFSPQKADWPGWLFYAGVHFVPNNPFWHHLQALNGYISRCQSLLQQGVPDNELLIYWPDDEVWHAAGSLHRQIRVHDVKDWLYPFPFYRLASALGDAGFCYDFISGN